MNNHATTNRTPAGRVFVAPRAIASIAAAAALQTDGVAGLSDPQGPPLILPPGDERRGIEVHVHQNNLEVDVYLIVRAGRPIADVASAAQSAVRAALSFALDLPEPTVNIRVQGVGGR
ncbi:MAG: Asp23/Gls24 family envelope stress response protein [Roseiflexus sp.]|nr:Asp23/Gls24 family envelope stress response protein [Roseiflexus sp.]MCS7288383.1 Asp23/Gls24 family envelope stress response protein [Roseiflexus sp.]MDW8146532.1 Asp23/Gls24 family envelope stress response protein [Roseiflexaceae bacterium]MDW8231188.1 Asp23/Gls24 family envelope stress response protein [Roseiflexaceae bacterium]